MTNLQTVSERVKKANQVSLWQGHLRQAMRGSENAHLLSDFSSPQRVSPIVEGVMTFGAVSAVILVLYGCWVACVALGVVK